MVFSTVEKNITARGRFFKRKEKVSKIMCWQEAVNVDSERCVHRLLLSAFDAKKLAIGGKKVLFRGKHLQGHFFDFGWRADGCRQGIKREGMDGGFFAALDG